MSLKGRTQSEETRRKISETRLARGIKHTEETKRKLSELQKGKPASPGTVANLRKMAIERTGKKRPPFSDEWKRNLGEAHKGKTQSAEARQKISLSLIGNQRSVGRVGWNKGKTGFGGYTWKKETKTPENLRFRASVAYKKWRTAVFVRDDYTCQECGQRGGKLNADHIKPFAQFPELRLDLENGRTLCEPCHRETDTYGLKLVRKMQKEATENANQPPPAQAASSGKPQVNRVQ